MNYLVGEPIQFNPRGAAGLALSDVGVTKDFI